MAPCPVPGAEGPCRAGDGCRLLRGRPRARAGRGVAGGRRVTRQVGRAGDVRPRAGGSGRGPDLAGVLAGRDPSGERALRLVRRARPVSGFDLVFAAPKSVSVLHLLAHRELGAATGEAHRGAVADALGYLEGSGLGARRTERGSVHHVATTGAVAARLRAPDQPGPRPAPPHAPGASPTSSGASTAGGRHSTAVGSSCTVGRCARSTTPRSVTTWARSAGVAW